MSIEKTKKSDVKTKDKKTCFVVTPIGKPDSEIRRHIDGIINIAIEPALGDEYLVEAAHTYFNSTSITKQVYQKLYDCDLVIANLTDLNPNVMYELGIRFCFGKPTVLIAKKDTKLPFDINEQRTFFYIDDALGMLELRESIEKIKETINPDRIESPIHDALKEVELFKQLNTENDNNNSAINEMLSIIMKKIDKYSDENLLDEKVFEKEPVSSSHSSYIILNNRCETLLEELSQLEEGPISLWKLQICRGHLYECIDMLEKIRSSISRDQYILMDNRLKNIKRRVARLDSKI